MKDENDVRSGCILKIRRACLVKDKSIRQIANEFEINRRTARKMLEHSVPPTYHRERVPPHPKLAPHLEFIDQILATDKSSPKKQRHTIKLIYNRLDVLSFDTSSRTRAS